VESELKLFSIYGLNKFSIYGKWKTISFSELCISVIYHGTNDPQTGSCKVMAGDFPLPPRTDLVNHSPSGFAWGYPGSGPSQLSLAILAHHFKDDATALQHYQEFKDDVIARYPMDEDFYLESKSIDFWMKDR